MRFLQPPVRTQAEANADHCVVVDLFHQTAVIRGDMQKACYLASEWQVRQAMACLESHNAIGEVN